jgi:hypothetical protein
LVVAEIRASPKMSSNDETDIAIENRINFVRMPFSIVFANNLKFLAVSMEQSPLAIGI